MAVRTRDIASAPIRISPIGARLRRVVGRTAADLPYPEPKRRDAKSEDDGARTSSKRIGLATIRRGEGRRLHKRAKIVDAAPRRAACVDPRLALLRF